MLKFLTKLNTNLNLFQSLYKKFKAFLSWLKKHKILSIFLIIISLVIIYLAYQKFWPKPPEKIYNLTTVGQNSIKQTVSASGKIHSQTEVDLKFQASGQLVWVGVKQGDYVNQWQAIASLDQRELQKTLQQELIDYSKERNDFEQDRQETYKDTVLTNTIKRLLEKNQWDLERTVLDVEIKDIALKFATLITPISGIVTQIDVPVAGINITPATAVFTVADPDHLVFQAEIDEADIGLIQATQAAEIVLDSYPDQPIQAQVDWIDFNSTLDSAGSTVYIVKLNLDNSDRRLRLGMNGEVTITVAEQASTLTIPFQSVIETDDQTIVKLVKDGKIIDTPVTVGLSSEDDVEITSGLQPGQTIVVSKKTKNNR